MGILSWRSGQKVALEVADLMRSIHTARKSTRNRDSIKHFPFEEGEVLRRSDTPPACRVRSTLGRSHRVSHQEVSRAYSTL